MGLKVEYVPLSSITPYEGNAKKHTKKQIDQIKASIAEFGFNDPIAIWKDQTIIEGHGRLMAAQALGMETVPIIRLDGLTEEQRRAYVLVHNKLTMNTGFDPELLEYELGQFEEIDIEQFGFELPDLDSGLENVPRSSLQHNVFENQERQQFEAADGNWFGIPEMEPTDVVGDKLLRFCDFNQVQDHENYIAHFYYDDYKFINAWRDPDKYLDKLRKFKAVISPDFSLYTDFPRALQILSCYRRQWCGAYWQQKGLTVIPDVIWGDRESYKFCFLGIPKHSTVAVSTVGVSNDAEWNDKNDSLFRAGYDEMLNRLDPTAIIFYGTALDGLEGNIIRVPSFYEERRGGLPNKKKKEKELIWDVEAVERDPEDTGQLGTCQPEEARLSEQ